jgi:outer membrane immunogenic protein
MKKLALLTVGAFAFSGTAFAADMAVKAPRVAPAPVPCCVSWAGFYLGVHGGYGWKKNDFAELAGVVLLTPVFVGGIDSKGWLVGGHAGYNWQYGWWVAGVELDFSATKIKGVSAPAVETEGQGVTETYLRADDVKWLGTARARLGFTPFESLLLYGTAGLAWERFERTNTDITSIVPPGITITSTSVVPHDRFGWVAGVGGEAKLFGSNWIGRI